MRPIDAIKLFLSPPPSPFARKINRPPASKQDANRATGKLLGRDDKEREREREKKKYSSAQRDEKQSGKFSTKSERERESLVAR